MTDDIVTRLRNKYAGQLPICAEAADEIAQLRMDVKVLKDAYKHLRELVDRFAEHCRCEQTSATMLILHRAAMKHDPWSRHEAARHD